jgi:dehydrogenase/reductase SDR family member 7B
MEHRSMKRNGHFKDKVVWITGASSGIGEALACRLSGAGAALVLSSNEPERLEEVRDRCANRAAHMTLPLDLSGWEMLAPKATEVLSRFGRVDILVNNGGISHRSLAKDTDLAVDRKVMDIDYFGHIALTKAVLPSMRRRRSGHIVVTTSLAGLIPVPYRTAYCAAKHALHGFFDTLRVEVWDDNIKVTLVCPAQVRTNISYRALAGDGSEYGKMDPLIEAGMSPEECAEAIVKAIVKGKERILVGSGSPILGTYVHRFSPALFTRLVRKAQVI